MSDNGQERTFERTDFLELADQPRPGGSRADRKLSRRLSELGIERKGLQQVLELSLRNFNADPTREFVHERELLSEILDATW